MRKHILLIFGLSLVSLGIVSISAEPNTIPDWIKNTALWYGQGQVSDTEFINTLQFLINQELIVVPIKEVVATTVNLEDKDRAMSFVVHFSQGDFFGVELTIYTFHTFTHASQTINSNTVDLTQNLDRTPSFILQSLPSKDKSRLYELVNLYVDAGARPVPFDVSIDVISGDGESIQKWQYRKCSVNDYSTFVNTDKDQYRFSDIDEMEIRELFLFACSGFTIK